MSEKQGSCGVRLESQSSAALDIRRYERLTANFSEDLPLLSESPEANVNTIRGVQLRLGHMIRPSITIPLHPSIQVACPDSSPLSNVPVWERQFARCLHTNLVRNLYRYMG